MNVKTQHHSYNNRQTNQEELQQKNRLDTVMGNNYWGLN